MPKTALQYDLHPGVTRMEKWVGELKTKTGHSLDEWTRLIRRESLKDKKECRAWLKSHHKLGTFTATWLAEHAEGKGREEDSPEEYLANAVRYVVRQYSGKKAHLFSIYKELLALGRSLGNDVKVCPCKTMVPLYRNHVFAQITPATNARVDLGLCFNTYTGKLPKRLIDTGGMQKKDRITHRIELTSTEQIDSDLKRWLHAAYELDGAPSRRGKSPKLF